MQWSFYNHHAQYVCRLEKLKRNHKSRITWTVSAEEMRKRSNQENAVYDIERRLCIIRRMMRVIRSDVN